MRLDVWRRSRWIGVAIWCRSRCVRVFAGFAATMTEATPFLPGLSPVGRKSLTASQDAGNLTSNGGLIVLREAALRLGIADVVASRLPDPRNPLLITHTYSAMVTARMMAIAAGYEDADDLDALRNDPALMMACDRAPENGLDIPSQPTISRLENIADVKSLYRIGIGFIDLFCRGYKTPPASIVLDIDDTNDMVRHGGAMLRMDAASNWRCSTRMRAGTASSRSTFLKQRRASPFFRCCDRASGHRGRRSRACSGTSSIASAGTGRTCAF